MKTQRKASKSEKSEVIGNKPEVKQNYDLIQSYKGEEAIGKHRDTIKVTKILLLNGPYAMQGVYRDIRSKSLGAGVCELYTAEVVE